MKHRQSKTTIDILTAQLANAKQDLADLEKEVANRKAKIAEAQRAVDELKHDLKIAKGEA